MKKTCIIIPARNEPEGLARVLSGLAPYQPGLVIVLGNNFGAAVKNAQPENIWLVEETDHAGNGELVRLGLQLGIESGANFLIRLDGDAQHSTDYLKAVHNRLKNTGQFVLASRYHPQSPIHSTPPADRMILNRMVTSVINEITGFGLTDALSGYWGLTRELAGKVLPALTTDGYGLGLELLLCLHTLGQRVSEVPHPMIYAGTGKLDTIYTDTHRQKRLDRASTYLGVISSAVERIQAGWPHNLVNTKAAATTWSERSWFAPTQKQSSHGA